MKGELIWIDAYACLLYLLPQKKKKIPIKSD